MALTENTITDKIEFIPEANVVQVREATIVMRDGEEIAKTYHRYVITQDDDYSSRPAEVKKFAAAAFGG